MEGDFIKTSAFAAKFGISDRHARRLVNEWEADLDGHIEKRGSTGTWIDEYAEAFLREKLRNPMEILPAEPEAPDPAELQKELNEMTRKWAEAEKRASLGAAAAAKLEAAEQKTLLLQDAHAESLERLKAEHRANVAELKADYAQQMADVEKAFRETEKATEQQYRGELETKDNALKEANDRANVAEERLAKIHAKTEELARAGHFKRKKILKELLKLQEGKE